mgnify:CR=1 FL=1
MKKFHYLSILSMVVLAMLTFSACGDDDDDVVKDVDKSVVGEWAMMYIEGTSYLYMERINYKSNGTFTLVAYDCEGIGRDCDHGSISSVTKTEGTGSYKASDGKLTMNISGRDVTYYYKVSGTTLTITGSDGSVAYEKINSDILEAFNAAEQWYQEHK